MYTNILYCFGKHAYMLMILNSVTIINGKGSSSTQNIVRLWYIFMILNSLMIINGKGSSK